MLLISFSYSVVYIKSFYVITEYIIETIALF